MPRKGYLPTLAQVLDDTHRRAAQGVSLGRASKYDRGARLAAIGSSEKHFTGQLPAGDLNNAEISSPEAVEPLADGAVRADDRRRRTKPHPGAV